MPSAIVLCVDPEAEQLRRVHDWVLALNMPEYLAMLASNGQEALDAAHRIAAEGNHLAVGVVAASLPGMPAPELLGQLRREFPYMQAVVVGTPEELESQRKKSMPMPGHFLRLDRPAGHDELSAALNEALGNWAGQMQGIEESQPLRVLNALLRNLREMALLNSFHHAFLSACLRQTDASLAVFFHRVADTVKVVGLVAHDMDENMALQHEFQKSPDGLSQRLGTHLVGARAEMPTRLVLAVHVLGEPAAILLLERPDDGMAFTPMQREMANTLAVFLGEIETARIYRARAGQERKTQDAAKHELNDLKQLAAIQHQSLEQGIQFAKMVSAATMPPSSELKKVYEDSFLLFRPRDVVSGCFYWFSERYYKFLVALGDARAPGIGGAFLATLYHRLIDEISGKIALPKPRGLLMELNERMRQTVQGQPSAQSMLQGLRIALVSIDESVQVLRFAGADMPLWLVRNGEVKRLNSGSVPLGVEPFPGHKLEIKQHTLQLTEEDRVYVSTPGLLELRGGLDNSPFGADRFRRVLVDVATVPLQDQPRLFEQILDDWLHGQAPSHDVLLCGLQLPEGN